MPDPIDRDVLVRELLDVLDETFETHHGIYLDGGTSLFATLDAIDAAAASRVPLPGVGTIAAKVAHTIVYLEVIEAYLDTGVSPDTDWGAAWRETAGVAPAEWDGMRAHLRETWVRLRARFVARETWDAVAIGGALGLVAHAAYHLGEIRESAAAVLLAQGR